MLFAVSGSQGAGKSTVLKALAAQDYKVITRKTSRSILQDWGITLQEVNKSPELTVRFQDEITARKYEDEQLAIHSPDVWFTERTHTDLFVYALVTLGAHNKYSDWLNQYYNVCKAHNQSYAGVSYLQAGLFHVVHDGVRGSNQHYSRMVDITMLDFTKQMYNNTNLQIVSAVDVNTRVNVILDHIMINNKK